MFGPWLYVLITGTNIGSDTGVTATATGYLSQFMLDNLPDTQLIQLVVECGTYDGETMHHLVRDDHWLHLYGEPQSPQGRKLRAICLRDSIPRTQTGSSWFTCALSRFSIAVLARWHRCSQLNRLHMGASFDFMDVH